MKVDAGLMGSLESVPGRIRELEDQGYDGAVTAEMSSDPFLPLVLAAEHSERIELMTSIAVAFSRNPMIVAEPSQVASALKARFGGLVDRVLCTFPLADDAERRAYLEELRAA